MDTLLPMLLVALAGAPLFIGGSMLLDRLRDDRRRHARLDEARRHALGLEIEGISTGRRSCRLTEAVGARGSAIMSSGMLSAKTRTELEQTLRAGGLSSSHNLEIFLGSKIVLAAGLPACTFMLLRHVSMRPMLFIMAVAIAAVGGLMLPNMIIGQRRKAYLNAIDAGLADGLDMMVICAEAGLALEATLQRVSVEIVHAHPKLAKELTTTSRELAVASDVRSALANMGTRTGLVNLSRLGATLIQSVQYGTPLSAALRMLATELRQETLTRFEERAARLPVLLTIPMILFILPCVFLVVAGPIAVQVMKTFHH